MERLHIYRTPDGHRLISFIEIDRVLSEDLKEDFEGIDCPETLGSKTAIYTKVSSHDQKRKET